MSKGVGGEELSCMERLNGRTSLLQGGAVLPGTGVGTEISVACERSSLGPCFSKIKKFHMSL